MKRLDFRLIVLVSLLFSAGALSQTSKGFIVGNIVDPNGAAVTGATIKITNLSTGVTRDVVSGDDGSYRLEAVDPGTYRMEVTQAGFKTLTRDNVVVSAAQTTESKFQLEVGTQTETVNVTSGTDVILQTQDGARANTLSQREITDLPTPALNPTSIVFTLPGVVDPAARWRLCPGE